MKYFFALLIGVGFIVLIYKLIKTMNSFNSYNCPKCKKLTKHKEVTRNYVKHDTYKDSGVASIVTYECENCGYHWKKDMTDDFSDTNSFISGD
ncbi:MAG: hypothetical protein IPO21_06295 [Bacteroidales bacterium]|nr:hypothetical protein [Bacteroidales bacterium]